jgi:hypothetical protein
MRSRLATILLLTALALQPALAGGWGHRGPAPRAAAPQRLAPRPPAQFAPQQRPQYPSIPRDEAMRRAQQMNGGGRVLAVDPAQSGYNVRVYKNGEVRSVYVPGAVYGPGPGYPPPPPPPGYGYPPGYPPGR